MMSISAVCNNRITKEIRTKWCIKIKGILKLSLFFIVSIPLRAIFFIVPGKDYEGKVFLKPLNATYFLLLYPKASEYPNILCAKAYNEKDPATFHFTYQNII